MIRRFFEGPEPPKFHLLLIGGLDVILVLAGLPAGLLGSSVGWWICAIGVVHGAGCFWRFRRAARQAGWSFPSSTAVRSSPHHDTPDDT